MNAAILFSEMTPAPSWEAEFNTWYDEEHIPLRMAVPGFEGAQRYRRGALDYLAVYDMTEPAVLDSDAYRDVKNHPSETTARMLASVTNFTRYIGRPLSVQVQKGCENFVEAPVLYPVFFSVPTDFFLQGPDLGFAVIEIGAPDGGERIDRDGLRPACPEVHDLPK